MVLAAALPKKRCLELSSLNKCGSFQRFKVPDAFFWAKPLAANSDGCQAYNAMARVWRFLSVGQNAQRRSPSALMTRGRSILGHGSNEGNTGAAEPSATNPERKSHWASG